MNKENAAGGHQRGEVIYKILDTLSDIALTMPAAIVGMLEAGHGASFSSMEYHRNKNMPDLETVQAGRAERRRQYQRYAMMIRYLKLNGLLKERKFGESIKLYLTKEGRKKLAVFKKERKFEMGGRGYQSSPGTKFIIVTYDIPERMRKDREWVRAVLKTLGLKSIQRSVWLGKIVIPDRFIEDLALRHMTQYVEIVEVGSSGTVEHLI